MKYTIETINGGCVETIELSDGSKYEKKYTRTESGCRCESDDFADQMEADGINEEMVERVYDAFDSFLALDFLILAESDM